MFLLLTTGKIAGLGTNAAAFVSSRQKQIEPSPFEQAAAEVSDLTLNQAGVALQLLQVSGGQSLFDIAKQSKGGKTPQAKEAADKVKGLLQPGYKTADAYSGEGTNFNESKGSLTIGKSNVEVAAKGIISQSKAEIAQLKKDPSKALGTKALEARIKAEQSIGLYFTAIFQAKKPDARIKAGRNLDGALKALKEIKPPKKGQDLLPEQRAYLVSTLAIIQALINKSGTVITQQALLAQLKQLADGKEIGTVDELAKDLITKAEQATGPKNMPELPPGAAGKRQPQAGSPLAA